MGPVDGVGAIEGLALLAWGLLENNGKTALLYTNMPKRTTINSIQACNTIIGTYLSMLHAQYIHCNKSTVFNLKNCYKMFHRLMAESYDEKI